MNDDIQEKQRARADKDARQAVENETRGDTKKPIFMVITNGTTAKVIDNNKKRLWKVRQKVGLFCTKHVALLEGLLKLKTRWIHITCTYDMKANEWCPKDITSYVHNMAQRESVYAYCWIAEVHTKSKQIHYHVMFLVKKGYRFPMPDKAGHWKKGSTSITKVPGPYYLMKYLTKEAQKEFQYLPKGARTMGMWSRFDGLMDEIRYEMLNKSQKAFVDTTGLKHVKTAFSEAKKEVQQLFGGGWWVQKTTDDLEYANWLKNLWSNS